MLSVSVFFGRPLQAMGTAGSVHSTGWGPLRSLVRALTVGVKRLNKEICDEFLSLCVTASYSRRAGPVHPVEPGTDLHAASAPGAHGGRVPRMEQPLSGCFKPLPGDGAAHPVRRHHDGSPRLGL